MSVILTCFAKDIIAAYTIWAFQILPALDKKTGKPVTPDLNAFEPVSISARVHVEPFTFDMN